MCWCVDSGSWTRENTPMHLKANPDYKRLKQVPNLIISLDTEVLTPLQLSNTPQNPITDLIGY